ncbi:hypothetical protein Unana1_06642 [Umbelopsis nana]
MVPIYTFQLRHVQLDAKTWKSLLRKAGLFRGDQLKQEQLSEILWRQFDFSKIGIHNEEHLKTPRREFWNVIRTDGVDIEFLFKKMKATRDEPTPADFKDWLEYRGDGVTIWGVDPGVTDIFVAVDDGASLEDTDACRIRKTSTKEYYDLCGYNVASEKRSRWKREDAETASVIDKIPSFKTTNLPALTAAIQYVMANFQTITAHYDQQFRYNVLKLNTYKAKQKGLSEIGRRLTYGSKKYGMEPKPRHSHTAAELAIGTGSQFKPLPSKDRPEDNSRRHVILAYGNAAIGNVRSKLPAPSKALVHQLRQVMKCKGCFLSVVMIDEYLTYQVCAKCHQRTVSKVQERPTRGGHYSSVKIVVRRGIGM